MSGISWYSYGFIHAVFILHNSVIRANNLVFIGFYVKIYKTIENRDTKIYTVRQNSYPNVNVANNGSKYYKTTTNRINEKR